MPRKKKTNGDQPIGIGLTTKQMKRKKPIGNTYLLDIEPITDNQKKLFDSYAEDKHLVAYGTAGTGKTFLAVAVGLTMLLEKKIERIILSRPAVEAGERLGFLPGDMKEKVDPYLRPLYDSLYDLFDFEKILVMMIDIDLHFL